ncbi:MAG TPA: FMN-binding negative transcriptional regulator [Burkholderiales bacterium]|nr:FMN-binding negative transcriptional regulator [Burkholderiales bacterium]
MPASFAEPDESRLWKLVRDWPFATLISSTGEVPWVSHLPLIADENRRVLRGHMAKANPHWRVLDAGQSLAIFHGPHHYVSPSWYASQPSVPTWNYAVVHAQGKARATAELMRSVLSDADL